MDLLFIENVMMDSFLLLFVSLFLRQPTTLFKILGASAAGGIYCCVYTVWFVASGTGSYNEQFCIPGIIQSIAGTIISYVLLCMLMIFLAFGIHNKHILIKNIAVFYGAALFTGGVFQFLGNLAKPLNHLYDSYEKYNTETGHIGAWIRFCIIVAICVAAAAVIIRAWHSGRNLCGHLYDICLEFGEKKVHLTALLDTGNRLYEPGRGRPVTIIEKSAIDEVFESTDYFKIAKNLLYVPFHSIGTEHGMLTAVVADRIIINMEKCVRQYSHAVIGIYPGHMNGRYRGILHPDIVIGADRLSAAEKDYSSIGGF